MSTPAHLWLEDENGSPIVGSCLMPLRLGSIELKSFSHGVTIPVDPSWGKLTGTRVHRPITIESRTTHHFERKKRLEAFFAF